MTKKQNILLKASIAIAVLFAIAPASNALPAHYGGIPSGNILHCVGSHLPAVYRRRIFFHSKNIKTEQKH